MSVAFHSVSSFLHMGGYADYVWPAYAIVAVVLVANILKPLRRQRRLLREQDETTA